MSERRVWYSIGAGSNGYPGAPNDLLTGQSREAIVSEDHGDGTLDLFLILRPGDQANNLSITQADVPPESPDPFSATVAQLAAARAGLAASLNVDEAAVTNQQAYAAIEGGGYGGAPAHPGHTWRLLR